MKKSPSQPPYIPLGESTLTDAVDLAVGLWGNFAKAKGVSDVARQALEEKMLLDWYEKMMLGILTPIRYLYRLGIERPSKAQKLNGLADQVFSDESEGGFHLGINVEAQMVKCLQRNRIRDVLRPFKERLLEIQQLCMDVAERRDLDFTPVLPEPYQALLDRIIQCEYLQ